MRSFRMEVPCAWGEPGDVIVLEPLQAVWLPATADLLTDAFVETASLQAYK